MMIKEFLETFRASLYRYLVHSYIFSAIFSVIYVNAKYSFQYIHYNNWVISNTPLTKISKAFTQDKWILYQELPAHFRQKPKHAAKGKGIIRNWGERVNYSSIILSVIMVGFLKTVKSDHKIFSLDYTRQCKYYITCMYHKLKYINANWQQILHILFNQIYGILKM